MSGKLMLERDEGTVTSQDNIIEKETSSSSTLSHSYNVLIASNLSKGSSSPQMQERSVSTSDMNVAGRCAPRQEHGSSLSPSKDAPGPQAFDQVKKSYSPPHPQAYTRTDLNRKNLMILIQIMLKYLDNNDRRLCVEVKKAVAECTKKNREGHPEYRFLVDAITRRLRLVVGDWHWSQLENLMEHYRKKHANTGMSRPSDSVHKFVAV